MTFFAESSKDSDTKEGESSDKPKDEEMEVEYGANVTDTNYLKSVLEQLPGVENQAAESQDAGKSDPKEDSSKDKEKKKDAKK